MKNHRKNMDFRLRKYRPKAEKVAKFLLKKFCLKCGRIRGLGRGGRLLTGIDRCRGCPVFEALSAIDPRLKWIREEMTRLRELSKTLIR